jgi:hypothetical protein
MFRLAEIDPRPWGLALLLAAGVVVQIARPSAMPTIPPEAVMRPRIVADAPGLNIPAYPEIGQQMIFTPDRLHGGPTASADGPPTLVGVAAMGARVSTVLRTVDGVDHVVEVGSELAGWRLLSANDDHAVLQRGGATVTVKFESGASAQPPSIPPAASVGAAPAQPTPPVRSGISR